MNIKFSDLLSTFEDVNFYSSGESEGYICKTTGKIYFDSVFMDNEEELPDDLDDEKYWVIPRKNDLNLGRDLVYDFIYEYLPSEEDNIRSIFSRSGAYSKFKLLIEKQGKIEQWYKFEEMKTERALKDWCEACEIEITG